MQKIANDRIMGNKEINKIGKSAKNTKCAKYKIKTKKERKETNRKSGGIHQNGQKSRKKEANRT